VKRRLRLAAAAFALALSLIAAPPAAVSATAYGELFDAAWNAVNEHFYDPAFNGPTGKRCGASTNHV
jgi:hypothetical protein